MDRDIRGIPYEYSRWRYWVGPAGVGGWTTKPDDDGWFYSFWCKPVGKGARTGDAVAWEYVARMTSKRRRRKAAEARSYNLAHGRPGTAGVKRAKKPEGNQSGTGYCMREKKTVVMLNVRQVEAKNKRLMIAGECPDCGLTLHKYGKIAHCPECDQMKEMASSDYICKDCRAD